MDGENKNDEIGIQKVFMRRARGAERGFLSFCAAHLCWCGRALLFVGAERFVFCSENESD
jgi:hypothetical protein